MKTTKWRTWKRTVAVLFVMILVLYVTLYIYHSRRGIRQAEKMNFLTYFYSDYSAERNPPVDLDSHYMRYVIYTPINYVDRYLFSQAIPTGRLRGISYSLHE